MNIKIKKRRFYERVADIFTKYNNTYVSLTKHCLFSECRHINCISFSLVVGDVLISRDIYNLRVDENYNGHLFRVRYSFCLKRVYATFDIND